MRRFLALDTSTWWGSIALVERGATAATATVVEAFCDRVGGSHVETLLHWIERMLERSGWSKSSIDAYVSTCGPGSFTGVRVGLGTVRGLGLAAGRPCIGVNTLEALAEGHGPAGRPRTALIDAGRNELYAATYDADSSPPVELEPPHVGPAGVELQSAIAAGARLIPGPGTVLPGPDGADAAAAPDCVAAAAGRIVALRSAESGFCPAPLAPLYLRAPDAILKRRGR